MQEHNQRIEDPDDDRIITVCSDADFMKTVVPRQFFVTLDEAKLDCLLSCREYIHITSR